MNLTENVSYSSLLCYFGEIQYDDITTLSIVDNNVMSYYRTLFYFIYFFIDVSNGCQIGNRSSHYACIPYPFKTDTIAENSHHCLYHVVLITGWCVDDLS